MPEVDVSGMSQEERLNYMAEQMAKMPIGKAAVAIFEDERGNYIRVIQRSQDPKFIVMDFTPLAALELHASLGQMLGNGSQNN